MGESFSAHKTTNCNEVIHLLDLFRMNDTDLSIAGWREAESHNFGDYQIIGDLHIYGEHDWLVDDFDSKFVPEPPVSPR